VGTIGENRRRLLRWLTRALAARSDLAPTRTRHGRVLLQADLT
jgi:hypothetical protein